MQANSKLNEAIAPISTRASLSGVSSGRPFQARRMPKKFYAILFMVLFVSYATVFVSAQEATPLIPTPEVAIAAEMPSTPLAGGAHFRVAQFAPDTSDIDVYFNDNLAVKNLKFPSVSQWITVPAGTYTLVLAPSGQPASAAVIAPMNVAMSGDTWQTVAVIGSTGSTLSAALVAEVYPDLLPGTGGFTFLDALEGGPAMNLMRDNVVYFAHLTFPGSDPSAASASVREDSGTFDVRATAANDPNQILAEQTRLDITENAYTLVALIGTLDHPRLFSVVTDLSVVAIAQGKLPAPGTLMDALRADQNLTGFADGVDKAGLTDLLTGSDPYTIFAPANYALSELTSMNADALATLLRGHIVKGRWANNALVAAKTVTTLAGTQLTITTTNSGVFVNGVLMTNRNIPASNGVIFMLNHILAP
ncbi:MAG: fasciclin domain-containing protein [Chloroflexota bacterium]